MFRSDLTGERFSQLRNRSGLTESVMSKYLDVDESSILEFEKGENQFSVEILEKASELFGCTLDCFMNESDTFIKVPTAFKLRNLEIEDLVAVAAINKIALNLRFMEGLRGEYKC
jgi:transcriptional regulator with XRE-family HTH domain